MMGKQRRIASDRRRHDLPVPREQRLMLGDDTQSLA